MRAKVMCFTADTYSCIPYISLAARRKERKIQEPVERMCRYRSTFRFFGGLLLIMFRVLRTVSSRVPKNTSIRQSVPAFVSSCPTISNPVCSRIPAFGRHQASVNPPHFSSTTSSADNNDAIADFFAPPDETFESMGVTSPVLLSRIKNNLKLERPSAVQVAAYDAIAQGNAVTIGAETGRYVGKMLRLLFGFVL